MGNKKNILVLGAGYGGILTAKKIAKKYKNNTDITVTVIDKNSYHTMLTELHEVAAGRVPEESIRIDLSKVFYGRNIKVVLDEVKHIDFNNNVLEGTLDNYEYDYLVIGTGSKPTFYNCEGAKKHALTLWSYEDALKIKYHILDAFQKASVEKDKTIREKLLTFSVIGCGFTGIEMIGEIAEWRERLCHNFNIPEKEVKLFVLDMLPRVLPNFDDKLIEKTEKRLRKMGVEILTSSSIKEVGKDFIKVEGKEDIHTYTTIWAAGVESSDLLCNTDNAIQKGPKHRIQTDEYLRTMDYKNVYVVGDNIFFTPEGHEQPVPQMVENAEHSAALVAKNIISKLEDKEQKAYEPTFHGAMVCIGGKYGVAQVGTPKMQFVFSGFIAMLIKHFINVVYFMEVLGWHKVWTYVIHEFFHVNDRRSFLGGHFSKRSPNFWSVPLRLFVGAKWLIEGIEKLQRVIKDPNDIFLLASKIAVSGASEGAESAGEAVQSYGEALPVPEFITKIVDWSMDLVFYQPTGEFTQLATVFQTAMVIAEVGIGLALLGGLFTMLASVVSVVMCVMIYVSGMAPEEILWFGMAGIALIAGSGSTFGLDYYVLPFLKKQWMKLGFVRKWYLYN